MKIIKTKQMNEILSYLPQKISNFKLTKKDKYVIGIFKYQDIFIRIQGEKVENGYEFYSYILINDPLVADIEVKLWDFPTLTKERLDEIVKKYKELLNLIKGDNNEISN